MLYRVGKPNKAKRSFNTKWYSSSNLPLQVEKTTPDKTEDSTTS